MHLTSKLRLLNAALLNSFFAFLTSLPQPPNLMQFHEKEIFDLLFDQVSTSKWDITAFLFLWKCCSCNSNPKILKTKANIIKTKCTLVKSYTRMHYLPTLKKKGIIEEKEKRQASISWKETLLSCAPFWCSQSNSHLECLFTKTPQIRIFGDFLNPFYTVIWIHNRIWTCCFL